MYPACCVKHVASAMTNGTSISFANVLTSRVLPLPVGPMITILLLSSSQSSTSLPKSGFDILLISTGGVVGDSEDEDEGCDFSESFKNTSPGIELTTLLVLPVQIAIDLNLQYFHLRLCLRRVLALTSEQMEKYYKLVIHPHHLRCQ
mmetsp:Transcript_23599/g.35032  ORF Transcript_23599/g.35032 Transcript_23599/m.35032 type:complete len:147 (+) Transcript_23599:755-1195(+)